MPTRTRPPLTAFTPGAPTAPAAAHAPARIGPNAIIQTYHALVAHGDAALAAEVLHDATRRTPDTLPGAMVDEREAVAMVHRVRQVLDDDDAAAVLRDAGVRTARYLLANRIPRLAQGVMRWSPAPLAFRLLAGAMARHAWTFAGSGRFEWVTEPRTMLRIHDCPMCRDVRTSRPLCDYYAATFDTLVRTLVSHELGVREVRCRAMGDACCEFAVMSRDAHRVTSP
ncbi:MAG: bacteriochlorophyll 4-vinyl reductase [Gemmatimonadaceae bacterium]|nr:bacteriochlorophyll 4-vinyl reductase [Gemmatimonadaceae bacterium]